MSSCPSKDIHSIYIDGELPENFKIQYENHLAKCSACKAEYNRLKMLSEIFKADGKAISPDGVYLNQSFERLMIRKRYNQTKNQIKNTKSLISKNEFNSNKKKNFYGGLKYIIPAAAAAAVLALIIPVRTTLNSNSGNSIVASSNQINSVGIASNVSVGGNGSGLVVSGNIGQSVFQHPEFVREIISRSEFVKDNVEKYDIFRPKFPENRISVRIIVPGINNEGISGEIEMPLPNSEIYAPKDEGEMPGAINVSGGNSR